MSDYEDETEGHNFANLKAYIIKHSFASSWQNARLEWDVEEFEHLEPEEDSATCPCQHYPIRELCWLRNHVNRDRVFVGNVCVHRFMKEAQSRLMWEGLRRIKKDNTKAANPALLLLATRRGLLSEWDAKFYEDTGRKRLLSPNQMAKRTEINLRIIRGVLRQRHQGARDPRSVTISRAVFERLRGLKKPT